MKAVLITEHGGPEVLKYGDLPDPTPKPGELVVDVVAASVNGADWKVRAGESIGNRSFHIFWGEISPAWSAPSARASGPSDRRSRVRGSAMGRDGAYAEKIAIEAAIVAKKPDAHVARRGAALALTGSPP